VSRQSEHGDHGDDENGQQGPRVVALGGGHGLAATLQAARRYAGHVTAIVSVADDGGSSGRLRAALGIPAPGDLRRCLVALGDADGVWGRVFEHRFAEGDLEGHPVGNLVIAGLTSALGDFRLALDEAGRLVGATDDVIPATTEPVDLKAEIDGGAPLEGQVQVSNADAPITRVSLVPPDPAAPPEALAAIAAADQVVIGPGSLFSSVLAVVAVPAITEALAATSATKVYVCNLRPEPHETEDYDAARHLAALQAHGLEVDVVLHDPEAMPLGPLTGVTVVPCRLARPDGLAHDPGRLALALSEQIA
jgi:uncharacterized cofD-like protein